MFVIIILSFNFLQKEKKSKFGKIFIKLFYRTTFVERLMKSVFTPENKNILFHQALDEVFYFENPVVCAPLHIIQLFFFFDVRPPSFGAQNEQSFWKSLIKRVSQNIFFLYLFQFGFCFFIFFQSEALEFFCFCFLHLHRK